MAKSETELRIYNQEDRLNVAQILIKNGYAVRQTKKKTHRDGKDPGLLPGSFRV